MGKKQGGGVRMKQLGPKAPAMPIIPWRLLNSSYQVVQLPPPTSSVPIKSSFQEVFSMNAAHHSRISYLPSYLDSQKNIQRSTVAQLGLCFSTQQSPDISLALQTWVRHVCS
jgi:hypothetical protein